MYWFQSQSMRLCYFASLENVLTHLFSSVSVSVYEIVLFCPVYLSISTVRINVSVSVYEIVLFCQEKSWVVAPQQFVSVSVYEIVLFCHPYSP